MKKNVIAFWGYPNKKLIEKAKIAYPSADWVDLDIDYNYPKTNYTPDAYCTIIKNIFNNSIYLKDRIIKILAPIGKDKCDSAFFVSRMLQDMGFCVEESVFEDKCSNIVNLNLPISKSSLPLKQKIELITRNIYEQKDYSHLKEVEPQFGFWGVPPNDLSLLDLFSAPTEVFGWTRAVEAGYPGDIELEMYVKKDIPIVFFAQAFCSKTTLAKYLANKYDGLFVDVDSVPSNSIKAKIEAFLRLR